MLKTRRGSAVWLITQPAHAEFSGLMAAHWGNREFATPGYFGPSSDAERLRREVVLAIAEHDNGWWEWEADPTLSVEDGLPQGLGEVMRNPVEGMNRWRLGIARLSERHPYASLLISDHAYWLYASQFKANAPSELTHHLQRTRMAYPGELQDTAVRFVAELEHVQQELERRAAEDALWRSALDPAIRKPHARLLQTLDAFSLAVCSSVLAPVEGEARGLGEDHIVFDDVPRRSWDDRVSVEFKPLAGGEIAVKPFPFREAPLKLSVPVRVVESDRWWREVPVTSKEFTFVRG